MLPERLDFYELWLRSKAWRDGSMGLAPMSAVLGFLRTEDDYQRIMETAGRLAGAWTIASMSPLQRRGLAILPRGLRARAGLRIAAAIVRDVCSTSKASTKLRRADARLDVTSSLFCQVREAQKLPLCGFYGAAASEILGGLGLTARARIETCQAMDGPSCLIALDLSGTGSAADPALAA